MSNPAKIFSDALLAQRVASNKRAAQGFAPLKIRNREHGNGVSVEDFHEALLQAAENYFMCRAFNRPVQTAVEDALVGYIANIGPLTGAPTAIIQRAEQVKKQAYELDRAMGEVSNSYEILVRDMKRLK